MTATEIEIGEVRVSLTVGLRHAHRTERIAQLTLEYVREHLREDIRSHAHHTPVELESLETSPVTVRFDLMTDEMIARASAAEIHASLVRALRG